MAIQPDESRNPSENNLRNQDISDSARDRERLKPDEAFIDLPDVRDIPGQEHVHVPPAGEMADTTIASDDEEGVGLFDDEADDTMIAMGTENDITRQDIVVLETADHIKSAGDDVRLQDSSLENEDFEGEELNVSFDRTGEDLDVPGSESDDPGEDIGAEDEENNQYSLGGEKD